MAERSSRTTTSDVPRRSVRSAASLSGASAFDVSWSGRSTPNPVCSRRPPVSHDGNGLARCRPLVRRSLLFASGRNLLGRVTPGVLGVRDPPPAAARRNGRHPDGFASRFAGSVFAYPVARGGRRYLARGAANRSAPGALRRHRGRRERRPRGAGVAGSVDAERPLGVGEHGPLSWALGTPAM